MCKPPRVREVVVPHTLAAAELRGVSVLFVLARQDIRRQMLAVFVGTGLELVMQKTGDRQALSRQCFRSRVGQSDVLGVKLVCVHLQTQGSETPLHTHTSH